LNLGPDTREEVWTETLAQLPPMLRHEVEKAGLPAISGPNTLVLSFTPEYNLQREHCQEPTRLARIEEVLQKVTGRVWKVRVESLTGGGTGRQARAADGADSSLSRYRRQRTEALQEPLVKRAIDLLGAQIVHVDEGFGIAPAASADRAEVAENEEA
jgi:hypothetical protein